MSGLAEGKADKGQKPHADGQAPIYTGLTPLSPIVAKYKWSKKVRRIAAIDLSEPAFLETGQGETHRIREDKDKEKEREKEREREKEKEKEGAQGVKADQKEKEKAEGGAKTTPTPTPLDPHAQTQVGALPLFDGIEPLSLEDEGSGGGGGGLEDKKQRRKRRQEKRRKVAARLAKSEHLPACRESVYRLGYLELLREVGVSSQRLKMAQGGFFPCGTIIGRQAGRIGESRLSMVSRSAEAGRKYAEERGEIGALCVGSKKKGECEEETAVGLHDGKREAKEGERERPQSAQSDGSELFNFARPSRKETSVCGRKPLLPPLVLPSSPSPVSGEGRQRSPSSLMRRSSLPISPSKRPTSPSQAEGATFRLDSDISPCRASKRQSASVPVKQPVLSRINAKRPMDVVDMAVAWRAATVAALAEESEDNCEGEERERRKEREGMESGDEGDLRPGTGVVNTLGGSGRKTPASLFLSSRVPGSEGVDGQAWMRFWKDQCKGTREEGEEIPDITSSDPLLRLSFAEFKKRSDIGHPDVSQGGGVSGEGPLSSPLFLHQEGPRGQAPPSAVALMEAFRQKQRNPGSVCGSLKRTSRPANLGVPSRVVGPVDRTSRALRFEVQWGAPRRVFATETEAFAEKARTKPRDARTRPEMLTSGPGAVCGRAGRWRLTLPRSQRYGKGSLRKSGEEVKGGQGLPADAPGGTRGSQERGRASSSSQEVELTKSKSNTVIVAASPSASSSPTDAPKLPEADSRGTVESVRQRGRSASQEKADKALMEDAVRVVEDREGGETLERAVSPGESRGGEEGDTERKGGRSTDEDPSGKEKSEGPPADSSVSNKETENLVGAEEEGRECEGERIEGSLEEEREGALETEREFTDDGIDLPDDDEKRKRASNVDCEPSSPSSLSRKLPSPPSSTQGRGLGRQPGGYSLKKEGEVEAPGDSPKRKSFFVFDESLESVLLERDKENSEEEASPSPSTSPPPPTEIADRLEILRKDIEAAGLACPPSPPESQIVGGLLEGAGGNARKNKQKSVGGVQSPPKVTFLDLEKMKAEAKAVMMLQDSQRSTTVPPDNTNRLATHRSFPDHIVAFPETHRSSDLPVIKEGNNQVSDEKLDKDPTRKTGKGKGAVTIASAFAAAEATMEAMMNGNTKGKRRGGGVKGLKKKGDNKVDGKNPQQTNATTREAQTAGEGGILDAVLTDDLLAAFLQRASRPYDKNSQLQPPPLPKIPRVAILKRKVFMPAEVPTLHDCRKRKWIQLHKKREEDDRPPPALEKMLNAVFGDPSKPNSKGRPHRPSAVTGTSSITALLVQSGRKPAVSMVLNRKDGHAVASAATGPAAAAAEGTGKDKLGLVRLFRRNANLQQKRSARYQKFKRRFAKRLMTDERAREGGPLWVLTQIHRGKRRRVKTSPSESTAPSAASSRGFGEERTTLWDQFLAYTNSQCIKTERFLCDVCQYVLAGGNEVSLNLLLRSLRMLRVSDLCRREVAVVVGAFVDALQLPPDAVVEAIHSILEPAVRAQEEAERLNKERESSKRDTVAELSSPARDHSHASVASTPREGPNGSVGELKASEALEEYDRVLSIVAERKKKRVIVFGRDTGTISPSLSTRKKEKEKGRKESVWRRLTCSPTKQNLQLQKLAPSPLPQGDEVDDDDETDEQNEQSGKDKSPLGSNEDGAAAPLPSQSSPRHGPVHFFAEGSAARESVMTSQQSTNLPTHLEEQTQKDLPLSHTEIQEEGEEPENSTESQQDARSQGGTPDSRKSGLTGGSPRLSRTPAPPSGLPGTARSSLVASRRRYSSHAHAMPVPSIPPPSSANNKASILSTGQRDAALNRLLVAQKRATVAPHGSSAVTPRSPHQPGGTGGLVQAPAKKKGHQRGSVEASAVVAQFVEGLALGPPDIPPSPNSSVQSEVPETAPLVLATLSSLMLKSRGCEALKNSSFPLMLTSQLPLVSSFLRVEVEEQERKRAEGGKPIEKDRERGERLHSEEESLVGLIVERRAQQNHWLPRPVTFIWMAQHEGVEVLPSDHLEEKVRLRLWHGAALKDCLNLIGTFIFWKLPSNVHWPSLRLVLEKDGRLPIVAESLRVVLWYIRMFGVSCLVETVAEADFEIGASQANGKEVEKEKGKEEAIEGGGEGGDPEEEKKVSEEKGEGGNIQEREQDDRKNGKTFHREKNLKAFTEGIGRCWERVERSFIASRKIASHRREDLTHAGISTQKHQSTAAAGGPAGTHGSDLEEAETDEPEAKMNFAEMGWKEWQYKLVGYCGAVMWEMLGDPVCLLVLPSDRLRTLDASFLLPEKLLRLLVLPALATSLSHDLTMRVPALARASVCHLSRCLFDFNPTQNSLAFIKDVIDLLIVLAMARQEQKRLKELRLWEYISEKQIFEKIGAARMHLHDVSLSDAGRPGARANTVRSARSVMDSEETKQQMNADETEEDQRLAAGYSAHGAAVEFLSGAPKPVENFPPPRSLTTLAASNSETLALRQRAWLISECERGLLRLLALVSVHPHHLPTQQRPGYPPDRTDGSEDPHAERHDTQEEKPPRETFAERKTIAPTDVASLGAPSQVPSPRTSVSRRSERGLSVTTSAAGRLAEVEESEAGGGGVLSRAGSAVSLGQRTSVFKTKLGLNSRPPSLASLASELGAGTSDGESRASTAGGTKSASALWNDALSGKGGVGVRGAQLRKKASLKRLASGAPGSSRVLVARGCDAQGPWVIGLPGVVGCALQKKDVFANEALNAFMAKEALKKAKYAKGGGGHLMACCVGARKAKFRIHSSSGDLKIGIIPDHTALTYRDLLWRLTTVNAPQLWDLVRVSLSVAHSFENPTGLNSAVMRIHRLGSIWRGSSSIFVDDKIASEQRRMFSQIERKMDGGGDRQRLYQSLQSRDDYLEKIYGRLWRQHPAVVLEKAEATAAENVGVKLGSKGEFLGSSITQATAAIARLVTPRIVPLKKKAAPLRPLRDRPGLSNKRSKPKKEEGQASFLRAADIVLNGMLQETGEAEEKKAIPEIKLRNRTIKLRVPALPSGVALHYTKCVVASLCVASLAQAGLQPLHKLRVFMEHSDSFLEIIARGAACEAREACAAIANLSFMPDRLVCWLKLERAGNVTDSANVLLPLVLSSAKSQINSNRAAREPREFQRNAFTNGLRELRREKAPDSVPLGAGLFAGESGVTFRGDTIILLHPDGLNPASPPRLLTTACFSDTFAQKQLESCLRLQPSQGSGHWVMSVWIFWPCNSVSSKTEVLKLAVESGTLREKKSLGKRMVFLDAAGKFWVTLRNGGEVMMENVPKLENGWHLLTLISSTREDSSQTPFAFFGLDDWGSVLHDVQLPESFFAVGNFSLSRNEPFGTICDFRIQAGAPRSEMSARRLLADRLKASRRLMPDRIPRYFFEANAVPALAACMRRLESQAEALRALGNIASHAPARAQIYSLCHGDLCDLTKVPAAEYLVDPSSGWGQRSGRRGGSFGSPSRSRPWSGQGDKKAEREMGEVPDIPEEQSPHSGGRGGGVVQEIDLTSRGGLASRQRGMVQLRPKKPEELGSHSPLMMKEEGEEEDAQTEQEHIHATVLRHHRGHPMSFRQAVRLMRLLS
uniref:Uncharacterized protein n=1 Tax=Chromera velia CCMP2878 TaxID=1169474 RepID=A0A0G4HQI6_9ALVE|eukprot:Cvel_7946.t1-p1 / transcript=Cvel_7946.t1 / gene=Cvel_7946 / organism=Chromera_velia_CCMP2878 / gene_product=hypothetical protein / transcript_product=hypothetical protein / location=Cvel_scaffold427:289-24541(-) / protein_length=3579 / sequence_SO=supercontig / SO=protein_coding / is_pseudo=false